MADATSPQLSPATVNFLTAEDVAAILRTRGWIQGDGAEFAPWLERAATLLGPQASEGAASIVDARAHLEDLLALVFQYDARAMLATAQAHEVLARTGAREVIRELAHLVLGGPDVDSDRFKEIVNVLKEKTELAGRGILLPVRLALAGRAGEGELDRVILLLDAAARLPFAVPVKGTRQRLLEFCSALD